MTLACGGVTGCMFQPIRPIEDNLQSLTAPVIMQQPKFILHCMPIDEVSNVMEQGCKSNKGPLG